jgi:hypothetical protein
VSRQIPFRNFRAGLAIDETTLVASSEPRESNLPQHLSLADNIILRPDGKVSTRCGLRQKTVVTGSVNTNDPFFVSVNTDKFYAYHRGVFQHYNPITDIWTAFLTAPFTNLLCGAAYEDYVYVGSASSIWKIEVATNSQTELVGPPPAKLLLVHNDRLWAVDPAAPMTIQASVVGDPTDFTNGYSKTLDGEPCVIHGLGSLAGELFIFTNVGIWVQSGYAESDFNTFRLQPGIGAMAARRNQTIKAVELAGKGAALLFVDASGKIMGVNRNGAFEACGPVGKIVADLAFSSAAFQPESGLYIVHAGSAAYSVHVDLPYRDSGGRVQWPVTKITHGDPSITAFNLIGSGPIKGYSGSESGGQTYVWIFTTNSTTGRFPMFSYCQVKSGDVLYWPDDYTKDPDDMGGASNYYQVQGKIRLMPIDLGTTKPKTWESLTQKTNKPIGDITSLTLTQYMDKTLVYPVTITETVAPGTGVQDFEIAFGLFGYTEWTQLELNMFGSSARKATAYQHFLELHDLILEVTL